MTAYTNPATGRQEQIADARALGTVEQRTAAAKAAQAAFECVRYESARAGRCGRCGKSIRTHGAAAMEAFRTHQPLLKTERED